MNSLHEVSRVIIGDELECICDAIDNIAVCNYGHELSLLIQLTITLPTARAVRTPAQALARIQRLKHSPVLITGEYRPAAD